MAYGQTSEHEWPRGESELLGGLVAVFPHQLDAFSLAQPSPGYPQFREQASQDRSGSFEPPVDLPVANLFNFRRRERCRRGNLFRNLFNFRRNPP